MNILVLNNQILAVDPTDYGDRWETADQIIPKHVAEGATLVPMESLPEDYEPGKYTYENGFVLVPVTVRKTLEELKAERQAAVNAITVTVDGLVFDGDEVSQTRMARAIVVMQAASIPTISWVMHDNTVQTVTVSQLTQALAAAGAEQARLWVAPYEQAA